MVTITDPLSGQGSTFWNLVSEWTLVTTVALTLGEEGTDPRLVTFVVRSGPRKSLKHRMRCNLAIGQLVVGGQFLCFS